MPVTFVAAGTFSGSAAAPTPTTPTYALGDMLVVLTHSANENVGDVSGWNTLGQVPLSQGTAAAAGGVLLQIRWRFPTALGETVTVADSGSVTAAQVFAFRGVDPEEPFAGCNFARQAASLTWTAPSAYVEESGSMVVIAMANDRDLGSTTNLSGYTNANLTSITERSDATVNSGAGGGLGLVTAEFAGFGETGTTSITSAASVGAIICTFALRPKKTRLLATGHRYNNFTTVTGGFGEPYYYIGASPDRLVFFPTSPSRNVRHSTDGTSWTTTLVPTARDFRKGAFVNGEFLSPTPSAANFLSRGSADGLTWTDEALLSSTGGERDTLCYGNGLYFYLDKVSSNYKTSSTSAPGSWTARTLPDVGVTYAAAAFGNGVFVAISQDNATNRMAWATTSSDGINWSTPVPIPASIPNELVNLVFLNGYFVINGNDEARSKDGVTWEPYANGSDFFTGAGRYAFASKESILVVPGGRTSILTSTDSRHWLSSTLPANSASMGAEFKGKVYVLSQGSNNYMVGEKVEYGGRAVATATGTLTDSGPAGNFFTATSISATAAATGALTVGVLLSASASATATTTGVLTLPILLASATTAQATATAALTSAAAQLAATPAAVATAQGALTTAIRPAASVAATATASAALTTAIRLVASPTANMNTVLATLNTGIVLTSATTATATATGAVTTAIQLAASPQALATVTGALTTGVRFSASAAAQATITGDMMSGALLSGDATAASTATGALTVGVRLSASAAAETTASAALRVGVLLSASPSAVSTAQAALTVGALFAGSATAVATATSALTTQIRAAASAASVAAASAGLTTSIRLASSVSATTTATAALATAAGFAASAQASSTAAAALSTQIRLNAAVSGVSTATADLTVGSSFAGTSAATSTAAGALTTAIRLGAATTATAASSGALTTQIRLAGAAAASSTATAALLSGALFSAAASAVSTASGALTSAQVFTAAAAASASAAGALSTQIRASASAGAVTAADGSLSTAIRVQAQASASSTAAAELFVEKLLAGAAAAQSSADAELRVGVLLDGEAVGQGYAQADLTLSVRFYADLIASATASATLTQLLNQVGQSVFTVRVPAEDRSMRVASEMSGVYVPAQGGATRVEAEASGTRVPAQSSDIRAAT